MKHFYLDRRGTLALGMASRVSPSFSHDTMKYQSIKFRKCTLSRGIFCLNGVSSWGSIVFEGVFPRSRSVLNLAGVSSRLSILPTRDSTIFQDKILIMFIKRIEEHAIVEGRTQGLLVLLAWLSWLIASCVSHLHLPLYDI